MTKERYVIGCIYERLGNIMCQIGAYITYAKTYNRKLILSIIERNPEKLNQYKEYLPLLKKFCFIDKQGLTEVMKLASTYYEPATFKYAPIPDFENDIVVLFGFWQNEKFFDKKLIKSLYTPTQEIKEKIFNVYGDLSDATSISIRHGSDYVLQQDYFNVPSLEWYQNAYEKYFPNTKVIITSDDIEWAKNIKIKDAIFVENEQKDSIFWDMQTCSLCKNHITYPGSYGWLGAWLGEKDGSQVVCPDKWWGPKNGHITEEIIPDRWIKFKL